MTPSQLLAAGNQAYAAEDYERCFTLYTQALREADSVNDDRLRIDVGLAIADLVLYYAPPAANPFELRAGFCKRALDMSRSINYQSGLAASLRRMATLDDASADSLLRESLEISMSISDWAGIARVKSQMAVELHMKDEDGTALAAEGAEAARASNDPEALFYSLYTLSLCAKDDERLVYDGIISLCRAQNWNRRLMKMLHACATLACKEDAEKEPLLREAVTLAEGDDQWKSRCLEALSNAVRHKDPSEADELLAESKSLAEPGPDFPELGEALANEDWEAAEKAIRMALGAPR